MVEFFNKILQSFKINAKCVSYKKVRNVSLYDLCLEPGTRIRDIQKFTDEISLILKSKNRPIIKILSEQGIVRVEVVDECPKVLSFYEELRKVNSYSGDIPIYLGSSVDGENLWMDMAQNPHLLVAGCTGSGKSTLLHLIIANALLLSDTRICLIDTKNVDFSPFNEIKGFNIATDFKSANSLLDFVSDEMNYRYKVLTNNSKEKFENILFIIDEFADLIMQDSNKLFYNKLCKLTQKSRAAGIYCVVATQRPSADIIGGTIKANFPARISCQVVSGIDSKVILDTKGAELLAGNGDAIIKNYDNNYTRFQIAYTTPKEVCSLYERKINIRH